MARTPRTPGSLSLRAPTAILLSLLLSSPALAESFFVTNTDPQGVGGVFDALADANENAGPDEIVFAVGSATIFMTSPLFIVDGLTVRAQGGMPTLDGSAASSTTRGFILDGTNTGVTGIAVRNYPNVAIEVRGSNAIVSGCILSGSQFGVLVVADSGAGPVTIGGDDPADGNFIYDNTLGISTEPGATDVVIRNNVVGIDESDGVMPNVVGIAVSGDRAVVDRNVIAGSTQFGLSVPGSAVQVLDNNIGLTRDETAAAANATGVIVTGASIGFFGNAVSGNSGTGVLLGGNGGELSDNRIGLHPSLPQAFPNGQDGILVSGGTGYMIGATMGVSVNEIGGNGGHGIYLQGSFSGGNTIDGNVIGGDFPNAGSGLRIESAGNTVGFVNGFDLPNTISNNGLNGVEIEGPDAFGNDFAYNEIEGNAGSGIRIVDASDNVIEGEDEIFRNEIRGNGGNGIEVVSDQEIADRNLIREVTITDNDAFGIAHIGGAQDDIEPPMTELVGMTTFLQGTARAQATIDLYSDLEEEGEFTIGTVTADGDGDWFSPGSLALWGGTNLNATQTDVNGNTSEFSVPIPIPPGRVNAEIPPEEDAAICLDVLTGDEVVPPVDTDASGRATVLVETVGQSVTVRIEHSVENPTAAELRMGLPGENGPLVLDLGDPASPVVAGLSGPEFHAFTAGDHYLVVSSPAWPDGEIRSTFLCPEPGAGLLAVVALLGVAAVTRRERCG